MDWPGTILLMPWNTDMTEGCIQPDFHRVLFRVGLADSEGLGLPSWAKVPAVVPAPSYSVCCGHCVHSPRHPKPNISFLCQNHARKDKGNTAVLFLQHQHSTGTTNWKAHVPQISCHQHSQMFGLLSKIRSALSTLENRSCFWWVIWRVS